jgi:uncharacterized protein (UPF0276 family)
VKPTLLERDFNIPSVAELMAELAEIKNRQEIAQVQTQRIAQR